MSTPFFCTFTFSELELYIIYIISHIFISAWTKTTSTQQANSPFKLCSLWHLSSEVILFIHSACQNIRTKIHSIYTTTLLWHHQKVKKRLLFYSPNSETAHTLRLGILFKTVSLTSKCYLIWN